MLINEALSEGAGGTPNKRQPYTGNAMSPASAEREQLGYLADNDIDTDDNDISSHLRDTVVDPEETWGPVPPTAEDPYAQADPFVRGDSPLPTPHR
jgi:hypothetical protein